MNGEDMYVVEHANKYPRVVTQAEAPVLNSNSLSGVGVLLGY